MKTLNIRAPASRSEPPGPLLNAESIADIVGRSPAWVRRNVPHKIMLGYTTPRWYRADVDAWIESMRGEGE